MNGKGFENIKMVGGEPQLTYGGYIEIWGSAPDSKEAESLRVSEADIERWREEAMQEPPLRFDPSASYRVRRTPLDVVRSLPGVAT